MGVLFEKQVNLFQMTSFNYASYSMKEATDSIRNVSVQTWSLLHTALSNKLKMNLDVHIWKILYRWAFINGRSKLLGHIIITKAITMTSSAIGIIKILYLRRLALPKQMHLTEIQIYQ